MVEIVCSSFGQPKAVNKSLLCKYAWVFFKFNERSACARICRQYVRSHCALVRYEWGMQCTGKNLLNWV